MKKKISFIALFLVFASCSAEAIHGAVLVQTQNGNEKKEQLEWRGDAFRQICVDVWSKALGASKEFAEKVYRAGLFTQDYTTRAAFERDRSPEGFRKNFEALLAMEIVGVDKQHALAYNALISYGLGNMIDASIKSIAVPAKNKGGTQKPVSEKKLTEKEYKKICVDIFSKMKVSKECVEKIYDEGAFFFPRENFEDLYKKDPTGFPKNMEKLYAIFLKNRGMDSDNLKRFRALADSPTSNGDIAYYRALSNAFLDLGVSKQCVEETFQKGIFLWRKEDFRDLYKKNPKQSDFSKKIRDEFETRLQKQADGCSPCFKTTTAGKQKQSNEKRKTMKRKAEVERPIARA